MNKWKGFRKNKIRTNLLVSNSSKNIIWLEKYRPKKLSEFLGHRSQVDTIKRWIKSFKNNVSTTKRFLLLYGPPGVGKTTIAHIILNEYGYDVVEFNSSDLRNKEVIKRRIINNSFC